MKFTPTKSDQFERWFPNTETHVIPIGDDKDVAIFRFVTTRQIAKYIIFQLLFKL